jgi:molecular chaperone DnaK
VRSALKGDDKDVIARKTEALTQASAKIAERAYAETQGGAGGAGPQPGGAAGAGGATGAGSAGPKDDVVDAEFEEVKDKDRRAS